MFGTISAVYGKLAGLLRWVTMMHSKKDFLTRPLMRQIGIAACFAILTGFMTTLIVAELTLVWKFFGGN